MKLRPYQREACDAFYGYLGEGGRAAILELATGLGKSLVAATICKELIERYPSVRIVVTAHVKELIEQNFGEMMRLWPQAPAGINSAGLGRRDWRSQILFCGIQSVHRHVALIGAVDMIIADEVHMISREATSTYQKLINELRDLTPDMALLGLSASPYRLDSGRVDEGEDRLFDKTVYVYGIARGIKDGYLSPLISKAMLAEIDTKDVTIRGGEFVAGELEHAAMASDNVARAVDEMIRYGAERRSWLAFCAGIKHAEAVTDALMARGIAANIVTGDTPKSERDARIAAFKRGDLRCLVNVMVLTTGFNVPGVDMIALLRPTQSPGLAIQQIGRGTRLAEGKDNCLILDFASILKTHGPVDQMAPPSREGKRKRDPKAGLPVRICPECNGIMPISAKVCEQCGTPFPRAVSAEPPNESAADAESVVLSTQAKPKWVLVHSWAFSIHKKEGKPDSLRVRYRCGLTSSINEFWCFDHGGRATAIAVRRWSELRKYQYSQSFFAPQSTAEAFENADKYLECPLEIMIRQNGKYFEVVQVSRGEEANAA